MPKKSSGRRKGIRQGVQRHRVGSENCVEKEEVAGSNAKKRAGRVSIVDRLTSVSYGRHCFNLMTACCEKLHLIGFVRTQTGGYKLLDGRARILHYTALVWYLAVCRERESICGESIDVLKSWSSDLPSVRQINAKSKFDPLEDFSTRLKVIGYFYMTIGVTLGMSLMTIAFDFPICVVPILADKFGVLSHNMLPLLAWKVIFFPLELFLMFPAMVMAGFSTALLLMGTGALRIYLEPVRKTKARKLQIRSRMERAYVEVEVFSRIFQTWIRRFFPPWLLMVAAGVILPTFISIRYTSFPLIVYINYPVVASVFVAVLFWQSHDMFRVGTASQDILDVLWKQHAPYFRGMPRSERIEFMKRAKAMRPLVFPVADSEFSLNVPMDTWEEILNQILFLLSL